MVISTSSYNIYSKSYRENLENILPDRIHDRLQDMSFTGQEDLKFIISDLASDLDRRRSCFFYV